MGLSGAGRCARDGSAPGDAAGGGLVATVPEVAGTTGDTEARAAEAAGNGPADMGWVAARRKAGVRCHADDRTTGRAIDQVAGAGQSDDLRASFPRGATRTAPRWHGRDAAQRDGWGGQRKADGYGPRRRRVGEITRGRKGGWRGAPRGGKALRFPPGPCWRGSQGDSRGSRLSAGRKVCPKTVARVSLAREGGGVLVAPHGTKRHHARRAAG